MITFPTFVNENLSNQNAAVRKFEAKSMTCISKRPSVNCVKIKVICAFLSANAFKIVK